VTFAIFGGMLAPSDPYAQNLATGVSGPSGAHWFGTDQLGRDIFSRVIVGSRVALLGAIGVAGGSMLVGNILGVLAGYRGGKTDAIIMRWVDVMLSLPALLVIIVAAGALGGGYWLAVALLALLTVPLDTRVVRAATLEQASRPYVEAARTLGLPARRIMLFHIWPNVSAVALANAFLVFANSLVALAALSYLGLGARPGTADWGLMVSEGQDLLFTNPVGEFAPAVAIVLVSVSMNLIGDWVFEQLTSRGATR
jgi:peptide/nickel transport system permease protein